MTTQFKRYDDAPNHWGVFIPVWFKIYGRVWHPVHDTYFWRQCQKHFIFTWKRDSIGGYITEIRVRFGFQYL
jgi:hypothetical protein